MRIKWRLCGATLNPSHTFQGRSHCSPASLLILIPFPQMAQGKGFWEGGGQGGWRALECLRSSSLPWDLAPPPPPAKWLLQNLAMAHSMLCSRVFLSQQPRDEFVSPCCPRATHWTPSSARTTAGTHGASESVVQLGSCIVARAPPSAG